MKKKPWKRIVFDIFSLLLIIVFAGLLAIRVRSINTESDSSVSQGNAEQIVQNHTLEMSLLQKSSLNNKSLLKSKKNSELITNIDELTKNQFKGAYVGIKGDRILFSGGSGYANAKNQTIFKLNSSFAVGSYQDFLNNAILVRMSQKRRLNLDKELKKYLPKLSGTNIKVGNFLKNKVHFYIKKSDVEKLETDKKVNIRSFSSTPSSLKYISVNSIIKKILITKVSSLSYEESLNEWLSSKLNLMDIRTCSTEEVQANDVIGYSHLKENGKLIQKNPIAEDQLVNGVPAIRMSMADIIVASYKILGNEYFDKKYNNLFRTMNNADNLGSVFTANRYKLSTHSSGQYLYLKADLNGSKIVLLAANYPNKNITLSREANVLFELVE
ncbi:hypothetical protein [Lactiplantibacillus paraxiangfangensis]|uniref:hypothetical protein n=1 Tax=Lactiplantibacillus paraxiangfangensis TaxID=3076224 RepID=UPI0030C66C81